MRSGARSSVIDIAEWLRLYARHFEDLHAPQNVTIGMREAADEIERLRQVLENIQQARVLQGKAIVDAANEIEHLRLALEVAANDLEDWGAYTKANNARAALEGE